MIIHGKISYRLKLAFVISMITVFFTLISIFIFYNYTYNQMIKKMQKNLADVGRVGALLFTPEYIQSIKILKKLSKEKMVLTEKEIDQIPIYGLKKSLKDEDIDKLQASKEFQMLVNLLRKISLASVSSPPSRLKEVEDDKVIEYLDMGMIATYIITDVPEYNKKTFKYIACGGYKASDNCWPGNPIGNVTVTDVDFSELFNGKVFLMDRIITDSFYDCLSAGIPLFDEKGKVIAALGLDYTTGRELSQLNKVKTLSIILLFISFLTSVLVSFFISSKMSFALKKLHEASLLIKNKKFNSRVNIKQQDEFGVLGKTFNIMAEEIEKTMNELSNKNQCLISVTADMHDGIATTLADIDILSRGDNIKNIAVINKLAAEGISEIQFMMNAMEYNQVNFELLCIEIDLLAKKILPAREISWEIIPNTDENPILPFFFFRDIRLIIKEALTNIIKHSNASEATLIINSLGDRIFIDLSDNGKGFKKEGETFFKKRGLKNMEKRIGKYQGSMICENKLSGFKIILESQIPKTDKISIK